MKSTTKKAVYSLIGALVVGVALFEYKRRREYGGYRHSFSRTLRRSGW